MGQTHWSDNHYHNAKALRAATNAPVFAHHANVTAGKASALNDKMNPHGVKMRESRDSPTHPESLAIAVLFDITGSMNKVPEILQENLVKLMALLISKGFVDHPQIMIAAIGDASETDGHGGRRQLEKAPLQIGQFESGIEIEEDLSKLYLEGDGGGQKSESYQNGAYFLARHTSTDCFEKRNHKGYAFFIGDEMCHPMVLRTEVERLIGDKLQADITTKEIFTELQQRYEVYFILPNMTSYYNDREVIDFWRELLSEDRFLKLQDPAGICELIASTIGIAEGKVDIDDLDSNLEETGTEKRIRTAVTHALVPLSKSTRVAKQAKGSKIAVPDSGVASGVATV